MAGSAGTTATTSLPDGAKAFIEAVLGTYTPGTPIMSVGTVLTTILSSYGGNPYEGVSAFNADKNFEPVDERMDTMQEKLDLTSWSDAVDAADTKAATVIDSVSIDSIFSSVVSSAIATATSAIVSAFSDAVSENAGLVAGASAAAIPQAQSAASAVLSAQPSVETEALRQLEGTSSLATATASNYSSAAAGRIAPLIASGDAATLTFAEQLLQRATQGGVGSLIQQMSGISGTAKSAYQEATSVVMPDSVIQSAYILSKMGALDCVGIS